MTLARDLLAVVNDNAALCPDDDRAFALLVLAPLFAELGRVLGADDLNKRLRALIDPVSAPAPSPLSVAPRAATDPSLEASRRASISVGKIVTPEEEKPSPLAGATPASAIWCKRTLVCHSIADVMLWDGLLERAEPWCLACSRTQGHGPLEQRPIPGRERPLK